MMKNVVLAAMSVGLARAHSNWANTTSSVEWTTSTIYTTDVHTVTKCPATVTDCPDHPYVTTETIAVSTTVCPVNETATTTTSETEWTTSTVYTTDVHTVTKCPPEVTDCPDHPYVTTETIAVSTTVCPVTESHAPPPPPPSTTEWTTSTVYTTTCRTITSCGPDVPDCPNGGGGHTTVITETIPVSTTVCPVTETETHPAPPPVTTHPSPPIVTAPTQSPPHGGNSTSTVWTTDVNTVTSCGPDHPGCSVGETTTSVYPITTVEIPSWSSVPVAPSSVEGETTTTTAGVPGASGVPGEAGKLVGLPMAGALVLAALLI